VAEGQTYNIPAVRFDWFKTQLEKLGRKAKKLNGERLFCTAVGFHNEETKGSRWYGQKIMEVFVACPAPKLADWEFVARIDHAHDVGNIVRSTGLRALPDVYRDSGPVCDHCGHKRMRRDTFIVYHEIQGFKQVGSSCLKDFLGHGDADRIAKLAELLSNIHSFARGSYDDYDNDGQGLTNRKVLVLENYLSHVAQLVLERGFVSKKVAYEQNRLSTAEAAMFIGGSAAPAAQELARKALEWAENLDETEEQPLNDYLHNVWVVANSPVIEVRSTGIAASIVGVYYRNNRPAPTVSQHVGTVDQKLEIDVKVIDTRRLQTGNTLVTMHDRQGNVLKWFATGKYPSNGYQGRITATVKKHDEFKGQKQTLVNRCKAL